jgi:SAM-dependent methyltransferase
MLNNQEFFDELSTRYDSMIPFEKALERKEEIFKNLLKANINTVADIGCGTGSDSLALARLGYKVTSFDPAAEMLNILKLNEQSFKLNVDSHQFGAAQIPDDFNNKFDVVISFGNSFANIPTNEFESSVYKGFSLLKDKGELYIQILNYEKILKEKERIVNITTGDDNYFIRFYDFRENLVVFNILHFDKTNPADHHLISTKIFPHSTDDFEKAMKKAGFITVNFFGSFKFTSFDPQKSNDLIIIAVK